MSLTKTLFKKGTFGIALQLLRYDEGINGWNRTVNISLKMYKREMKESGMYWQ
jgi:hypothetical protein